MANSANVEETEKAPALNEIQTEEKSPPSDNEEAASSAKEEGEKVEFKVIFNKKKYDITFPLDDNVGALKSHLQPQIGIPPAMMKVMIKGLAKDEMTLRKLGVTKGSKVMVVGSSLNDVLQVSSTPKDAAKSPGGGGAASTSKEEHSASKMKQHKKVLDKGKPGWCFRNMLSHDL